MTLLELGGRGVKTREVKLRLGHNSVVLVKWFVGCSQFSAHLGGSAYGVVSQTRPKQPHLQYHTPNQTQHKLLSVVHACDTVKQYVHACMD